jgi:hypothetical protein
MSELRDSGMDDGVVNMKNEIESVYFKKNQFFH